MKKTLLALTLGLSSTFAFADFDYAGGSNISNWDIGGEIAERCVVDVSGIDRATNLDLSLQEAQGTVGVGLWCNTRGAKAHATYSSSNRGVLENEEGDAIAYTFSIDQSGDLSLTANQTIEQMTGQGTAHGYQRKTMKITPMVTGREFAGIYRDTITVQVAPR
ncbi:hypothetical protein [Vibrio maerlii]|uniref:hypothetical protein n=1 Tax=Vibrio maerlii TaxID=2231648 RepID=UPI000E3C453E|nr:hypothetical protein [Vibrio maerlii]